MPNISRQDLEKFDQLLRKAYKRVGGGKVAFDSDSVRAAVRSNKAAAYRYVELHCHMAASQPGYLQPAIMIATAYHVEFNDETLVDLVMKRARELNAIEHLKSITLSPKGEDRQKTPQKLQRNRTLVVQCNGRDGKSCSSLIQIDDATEEDLRRGIRIKCPGCGTEHWVDSKNAVTINLDE